MFTASVIERARVQNIYGNGVPMHSRCTAPLIVGLFEDELHICWLLWVAACRPIIPKNSLE